MRIRSFLQAGMLGIVLAFPLVAPVQAQGLRVLSGAATGALSVPMNRAVVVESDESFAELSIANPAIADISTLSDRTIYVLGKTPGRTTLTLLNAEGRLIANVEVQVSPDIAEFKERLRQILPGEPIEVRTAADGIVMSGTVSSLAKLDRALDLAERYASGRVSNLMTVGGTQQVMLKVRFAEMQRSVRKSLGSSLAIGTSGGNVGVIGGTGSLTNPTNSQSILSGNGYTSGAAAEGALALGFNVGNLEFAVLMEALESKGVVRTLAEPNLTALSGQEASFLAGGEYPIPVVNTDGSVSIDYKQFGIGLQFTPRVVDEDLINLSLKATVSGLDNTATFQSGGISVNAFRTRETSTTVEMRDGESFAIAGLLEDDFQDLAGQVPWLADVPVLGALFRSAEYERQQSELVIIITPHLVTPIRGEALALPTDRIRPPTESDLFLLGRTAAETANRPTQGAAAEVARQDFVGSYGYVLEE